MQGAEISLLFGEHMMVILLRFACDIITLMY